MASNSPFPSVNEQRSDYDEQQDAHSTQYADTSHQFQSLPSSTQATVGSQSQETAWYQYYDFIANVDQGQAPYWQLKTAYTPSKEYPQIMPIQEANTTPLAGCCLESGCDSHKPFKRKADLERHYQQVHRPAAEKPSYPCDYSRCGRATDPFYRRDHSRDHYREYHREDIMRRSSSSSSKKQTAEWWGGRVISAKWWRCSKCLRRVYLQKDHFECRDCKATCEAERRKFRGYD
ncbi:putative c2h2 finger domain-containing protein [Eutypa lata UCREL1]|uniref:Putative c2h2 finger domain-containing protein n=1 Tax=Eutypa lata (strain UCR-EL1) TaxID=1287681 RepID=M7SQ06_EUTLA|nr:putative c2h2 finger domain-containing protein [Eutypa lata UCREL1]